MQIISVPHQTLRAKTLPVTNVTPEILTFISELGDTLIKKRNPRGVGLSSPQVDKNYRIFVTNLAEDDDDGHETTPALRAFINPEVISTSKHKTFGPNLDKPILEGCLSIPKLYGPVPRFEWVEYKFQEIVDGQLKTKYATFYDYDARVMQHEFDHLEGILFTDYILEYDLPLYEDSGSKMIELKNKDIIKHF